MEPVFGDIVATDGIEELHVPDKEDAPTKLSTRFASMQISLPVTDITPALGLETTVTGSVAVETQPPTLVTV
jgi:hypothetical protein